MSEKPAWKLRDDRIALAFKEFIEERERAWKIYFDMIAAEKKTKKAP